MKLGRGKDGGMTVWYFLYFYRLRRCSPYCVCVLCGPAGGSLLFFSLYSWVLVQRSSREIVVYYYKKRNAPARAGFQVETSFVLASSDGRKCCADVCAALERILIRGLPIYRRRT